MSQVVYIAGPMRGHKWYNYPAFEDAACILKAEGYQVISPVERDREFGFDAYKVPDPENHDWTNFPDDLKQDGTALRCMADVNRADILMALPGWQNSKGSMAEAFFARFAGKTVLEYETRQELQLPASEERAIQERGDILRVAHDISYGARNRDYGDPADNMYNTARIFNAKTGRDLSAYEAATFCQCIKDARMIRSPGKADHYVDSCNYTTMRFEIYQKGGKYIEPAV